MFGVVFKNKGFGNTVISKRTGTEGPSYDPYHYDEITVERGFNKITYHSGLQAFVIVEDIGSNPIKIETSNKEKINEIFVQNIGHELDDILKALHKIKSLKKCRQCGSKKLESMGGFAGESFTMCHNGHVIDYDFNINAII